MNVLLNEISRKQRLINFIIFVINLADIEKYEMIINFYENINRLYY